MDYQAQPCNKCNTERECKEQKDKRCTWEKGYFYGGTCKADAKAWDEAYHGLAAWFDGKTDAALPDLPFAAYAYDIWYTMANIQGGLPSEESFNEIKKWKKEHHVILFLAMYRLFTMKVVDRNVQRQRLLYVDDLRVKQLLSTSKVTWLDPDRSLLKRQLMTLSVHLGQASIFQNATRVILDAIKSKSNTRRRGVRSGTWLIPLIAAALMAPVSSAQRIAIEEGSNPIQVGGIVTNNPIPVGGVVTNNPRPMNQFVNNARGQSVISNQFVDKESVESTKQMFSTLVEVLSQATAQHSLDRRDSAICEEYVSSSSEILTSDSWAIMMKQNNGKGSYSHFYNELGKLMDRKFIDRIIRDYDDMAMTMLLMIVAMMPIAMSMVMVAKAVAAVAAAAAMAGKQRCRCRRWCLWCLCLAFGPALPCSALLQACVCLHVHGWYTYILAPTCVVLQFVDCPCHGENMHEI